VAAPTNQFNNTGAQGKNVNGPLDAPAPGSSANPADRGPQAPDGSGHGEITVKY
jgi:hypothetical protein